MIPAASGQIDHAGPVPDRTHASASRTAETASSTSPTPNIVMATGWFLIGSTTPRTAGSPVSASCPITCSAKVSAP